MTKGVRAKWPVTWQAPKASGLPGVVPNYGRTYSQRDLETLVAEVDQTHFGGRCCELGLTVTVNVPRRKRFDLGTRRLWFATYNEKKKAVVVQPYVTSRRFAVELVKVAIFHAMLFAHTILQNEHEGSVKPGAMTVVKLMRNASFVAFMDKEMDSVQFSAEYKNHRREFLDWACSAYAPEIKQP